MSQFIGSSFSGIIKIDNVDFTVGLVKIKRKVKVLDKFAQRTIDGDLKREILGVYFLYNLEFAEFWDMEQYDRLFKKLTEPREFHKIQIISNTGISAPFNGYVAGVEDVIEYANGNERRISGLKCELIAKEPTFRPRR